MISFVAAPVGGAAGALVTGPASAAVPAAAGTAIICGTDWGREKGLFARPFLQLQAETVLLHLEDGEIVFFHQVDDGFDIFEFQRRVLSGVVETLGKAVLMTGSSRGLAGAVRETLLSVIENPLQLRSDNETIEERAEGGRISDQIAHFRSALRESAKPMFMVPDAIEADPLFIDETMRRIQMAL